MIANVRRQGEMVERVLAKARDITREELYALVWQEPLAAAAQRFGLSSNGLAKLCDRLDVPRPGRSYWLRSEGRSVARPPLPAAAEGAPGQLATGLESNSRINRPRTRLTLDERRTQLLDTAARLALEDGVQKVTMKTVAKAAGISEAQAHNCFEGRSDLLLNLALRETRAIEALRVSRVGRGKDRFAKVVISTVSYLHEAYQRGPLLQILARLPEVRAGLRRERGAREAEGRRPLLDALEREEGIPRAIGNAATAALVAVTLRAGGMIASRRVKLDLAERLCLSVVMAGTVGVRRYGNRKTPG